jgi:streptomycin 6-kinase
MNLRQAVTVSDFNAAMNRLALHGNPVELEHLTDEQYTTYLATFGEDQAAKRVIANAINRPIPGEDSAHR